jgi:probable F420-dependent oxidoreductase
MTYAEIRDLALQVEEAGFDSVWIYDHLLYRFPDKEPAGVWEGWTIMSALAEATSRVDLGALVLCTAFRNPAVLAKMAVTLDEVSGGRIILGLGCGWHDPEFSAFGLQFDHRVDQFEEALQIITPLVREGTVDFRGDYYQAPDCEMLPRPKRSIPVLIASAGPRMNRLTARYADSWNTAWFGQAGAIANSRQDLEAACADLGREPGTLEVTVGVNVAFPDLAETPERIKNPEKSLSGDTEAIAAGLRGYEAAGVGHVICSCVPIMGKSVSRLAEAHALWRRGSVDSSTKESSR